MMIAEVTSAETGRKMRVGVVGSCRVHDPMKSLVRSGFGRVVWYRFNAFTHGPLDAGQYLQFCRGQLDIPDRFAPYIFRKDAAPRRDAMLPKHVADCDAFVVELCAQNFLRCGEYSFQADYFAQLFIRGRGQGVLQWWRGVVRGTADRTKDVEAALKDLQSQGPVSDTV